LLVFSFLVQSFCWGIQHRTKRETLFSASKFSPFSK
jgi:hypothetical protein